MTLISLLVFYIFHQSEHQVEFCINQQPPDKKISVFIVSQVLINPTSWIIEFEFKAFYL